MSDVKRIKLYKENHVDRNYLIPCYARLCERGEPLTAEEGLDLGMIDVIQIAAAREQARSSFLPSGARSPLTPTIHGADLDEVIRQVFQIAPHEPGFNPDETTHITGALVLLSQLKSFLCPSNQSSFFFHSIQTSQATRQPTHKPQSAHPQKQGTKKQTKHTGTAQPPTTATPQKPAATPTPTRVKTTQVVPPPKETTQTNPTTPAPPLAEQAEEATATATKPKSVVTDDVAGQQQKAEGVSRTGATDDTPLPDSELTELNLLVVGTGSNADNTTLATDTTFPDFTNLEGSPADVTSSSSIFSSNPSFTFGQLSSSSKSIFDDLSGSGWPSSDNLY